MQKEMVISYQRYVFRHIKEATMDWTHRLRLRHLQLLLSLATTGNMSQTANALNTTQPAVSKWLKELEDDVGVPLFERVARGLRPTPQGEALIAHARRIDSHLDIARDDMEVMRKGGTGLVAIGFAGASSVDTVPMAVLKILEQIPNAHIRLLESKIEALMTDLSAGVLDVVVGPSDFHSDDPLIRGENLYNEPIHLVTRVDHPIHKLRTPTWVDALSYPWALWARGNPVRTALDRALADAEQTYPPTYVESNSATLTTTLLIHSDMIGVASRRPALRYSRMKILAIVPLRLAASGSVSLYWRTDAMERPAVHAAVEGIRQVVRESSIAEPL